MDVFASLKKIREDFSASLSGCTDLKGVEDLKTRFLGRKGELNTILRSLSEVAEDKRPLVGQEANRIKNEINSALDELVARLESQGTGVKGAALDVTLPGVAPRAGSIHPITRTILRINEIFVSLGFTIAEGPQIETEFYNFEALNIPLDHPSRDAFDTFYIDDKYLLRSHTSNVQIHVMQTSKPPIQVIMPGRVYRPDAVDASHSFMFHQVEGLMVDKGIRFSDLKGVLLDFCRGMFGEDTKIRLRPHFFPFTEPSAEVDISCIFCKGKGCRVCKNSGWLEILGAGSVNPYVFEKVGYDSSVFTGFAFGMGVERITMLLCGIDDIRLFFENDVRFLKQFS